MIITGEQLIGFSETGEKKGAHFTSTAKQKDAAPYTFHEATTTDVHKAVQKANQAFTLYKMTTPAQRVAFLKKIAEEISALGDTLITLTQQETNLPEKRLQGERQRTLNQIQLFADLLTEGSWIRAIIDTGQPGRQPLPKPDIRQMQIPLGVTGVFGASNFPFAFSVAGGDTMAALAAGCPVVYKAHPGHPATSELVGQCLIRAAKATGMPDGVFSLLQGSSHQAGQALVTHPLVKAIAFTGSFRGGKALFDAAVRREEPIPVYAEMGSVNPVFVLPGILQQQGKTVADALAASNRLGAGQFCTNPGIVVLLPSKESDQFLEQFAVSQSNAVGEPMLTDTIYQQYNKSLQRLHDMQELKKIACGTAGQGTAVAVPHAFVVSGELFLQQASLHEEVFGPCSIHVVAENKEQLFEIARALTGQLTATVWGTHEDWEAYASLLTILQEKAGRLIINGVPTGVEVGHAMVHGGPYPATTDSKTTSVGSQAIYRFTRPVCFQDFPPVLLPDALQNENKTGILRMVNGKYTTENI
jgi:2,5-dioxopentanoate dehydrogenase